MDVEGHVGRASRGNTLEDVHEPVYGDVDEHVSWERAASVIDRVASELGCGGVHELRWLDVSVPRRSDDDDLLQARCMLQFGTILRRQDGNLDDAVREDLARAVLVAFLVGTVTFLGHRGLEVSMDRKRAWLCDWVVSECTTHECGIFCAMRLCYLVLSGLFWNRQLHTWVFIHLS